MKHCQPCHLDFPSTYRFCGLCGGTLDDSVTCDTCGEIVESKWKFCTGCGKPLAAADVAAQALSGRPVEPDPPTRQSVQSDSPSVEIREWYTTPEVLTDVEETTTVPVSTQRVRVTAPSGNQPQAMNTFTSPPSGIKSSGNGKAVPTLTMLSAYGKPEPIVFKAPARSYAFLPVLALVLCFAVVGFGGWYWWTHRASAAAAPEPAQTAVPVQAAAPSEGETPPIQNAASDADTEWRRLRQERINALPSDRTAMIAALGAAEKKYGTDYRFAYERAKLSIKGITSHHEAFDALADAAGKAIDNGKTEEMLNNLTSDKDGDFWKLARGHHEWNELIESLTAKDKQGLKDLHH